MQLTLQSQIETDLKSIILDAIEAGRIDPELLRMIILSPDSAFNHLEVFISNDWDNYFSRDYAVSIGRINIGKWLDVADEALEIQMELDGSYIERAKEIDQKYPATPAAISFNHLGILEERYVAFLKCLREDLLSQTDAAIIKVATSFSQKDFKQLVGFFTHKLTFNLDEDLLIHAFNNPEGAGPFYKVRLTLPSRKYSKHYLRFLDREIRLFCTKGTILGQSDVESEVYCYDISEISFAWLEDKSIYLRLSDEFQNWELESERARVENGEKSEADFLVAAEQFFGKFPDKLFFPEEIPNPLTDETNFLKWFYIVSKYNLKVKYATREKIFNYGEDAFRYYVQLIPKTDAQYEPALKFLGGKLFYLKRFKKSLDEFKNAAVLDNDEKIIYLCALFCLGYKEKYESYRVNIDAESDQILLELLDILWQLRESQPVEALKDIEAHLTPLLITYKNSPVLRLLSVVLTKTYVALGDKENALLHLQSVPTHETFEQVLLLEELKNIDYILQSYDELIRKAKEQTEFEKYIKTNSLNTSTKEKVVSEKTIYEYSYYPTIKIKVNQYNWACPISAHTFIAIDKENGLILSKINEDKSIEIIAALSLPESRNIDSCTFFDGTLYMADEEEGIITYIITEHSIKENSFVYKNKLAKTKYRSLAVANGYLFASNNNHLETFELDKPEAQLISNSLYLGSAYYLFVHKNLLVVGAGAGMLLLVDVTDKTTPVFLSAIQEDFTPNKMHVEFIGDYLVSRSLYDIKDPHSPRWISFVGDELTPTYYFTEKPEVPIISTGSEFLLTTLRLENESPVYTNWFESLNTENLVYERSVFNLATAFFGDTLITYAKYDVIFWQKLPSPKTEQIDVHKDVEHMVEDCLQFILDQHPDFNFSKVIVKQDLLYQHIDVSFHGCSSLATITDGNLPHELPVISSKLLLNEYCEVVFEKQYEGVTKMKFDFDADALIQKLLHNRLFEELAARHVLINVNEESAYMHSLNKQWKPFRQNEPDVISEKNLKEIILSNNDNLVNQLTEEIGEDLTMLNELLDILNKKIYKPESDNTPNNSGYLNKSFKNDIHIRELMDGNDENLEDENVDDEEGGDEEFYCSPEYIIDAYYAPTIETARNENWVPSGFLPDIKESYLLKSRALEILCKHPDKKLLRNIILNGMKFGYLHYSLKDMPDQTGYNLSLMSTFLDVYYGLWNTFGNDPEIRSFLVSSLNELDDPRLTLLIAYKYGQFSHSSIQQYIEEQINSGLTYYNYKGEATGIDLSSLPAEVFKPLESLLLEKSEALENTTDAFLQIEAKEQLVYFYILLNKLGHEHMPAIVSEQLVKAVKDHEQYGHLFKDDDEYEDEDEFLVKIYRKTKVARLLNYYQDSSGAVWPLEEPLELFAASWDQTINALLQEGTVKFGDSFATHYVNKLANHICLDDAYEHDRHLAYQLVQYSYKYIQEKPRLASLVEPLVFSIYKNKAAFPEKLDISTLKEKSKLTLLQAAWNNLKNQDFNLAEQMADALLDMDPTMGQVYFLKARLLWLREGIAAYLNRKDIFIEKASHDIAAVARLHNLSGCALDEQKRYEEALDHFKKAALAAPNDWMYVANVAEIYYKLRKPKEALKHAKAARANGNTGKILEEIIKNQGIFPEA